MPYLDAGCSRVQVNPRGGFFNWMQDGRPVMPLINVPGGSKQRSSHLCFPIFGLHREPLQGATQLMERHGPFRTSELTVLSHDKTKISMELVNRPTVKNEALLAQYPYFFVTQQHLELLGENTLHFRAEQTNLSECDSPSTLALHSYFDYTEAGVRLVDLQGHPYEETNDGQKLGDAVLTNPLISGPLVFRDWKFPAAGLNDPLCLIFPDGRKITMKVAASRPAVNNWMVWMDPTQCNFPNAFICVEPMIEGARIESRDSALLDVLISVE